MDVFLKSICKEKTCPWNRQMFQESLWEGLNLKDIKN